MYKHTKSIINFSKNQKNKRKHNSLSVFNTKDDSDSEMSDTTRDINSSSKESQKISREDNHIYFYSEVNRDSIFELTGLIRKAEHECTSLTHRYSIEPNSIPIYLHISSFGGSVFDAFTAIDIIKSSTVDIHTIIDGATASASTLMSIVGKKRYIRPSSFMLIHQLSSGSWGKMNELEDDYANNKKLINKIKNIYKEYTKIPKKELSEILKHDLWWDSEICIKYGLCDELRFSI